MKQRSTPERRAAVVGPEARVAAVSAGDDLSLLRGRMEGETEAVVTSSVVIDTALPMVGRAAVALDVATPASGHPRLIEILQHSSLERRDELIDKLESDAANARGVRDVLTRVYGVDAEDPAFCEAVAASVSRLERALTTGAEVDGVFRSELGELRLSSAVTEGSVRSRAEALVSELASVLADVPAPGRSPGDALCAVVLALQLALWDEEEEDFAGDDLEVAP